MKRRGLFRGATVLLVVFSAEGSLGPPVSADVALPVVSAVVPRYPAIARQARVSGSTSVSAEVDAQGVPGSVTPQNARIPLLTEACMQAVSEWRFSPGAGEVTRSATVTCTFHLVSRSEPEPPFPAKVTMPGLVEIIEWEPAIEVISAGTRATRK